MIQESGRFKEGNFNVSLKKETGKNHERTIIESRYRVEMICNDNRSMRGSGSHPFEARRKKLFPVGLIRGLSSRHPKYLK